MGFVANFVFNLHAGVRTFVLASHSTVLSPTLMVDACDELRPSMLNTVPWIVEGLCNLLAAGRLDVTAKLKPLRLITYGGAALSAHCVPILRAHNLAFACTYGQTEVAGPVMTGAAGGDPDLLLPLEGVGYRIASSEGDMEGEGELLLLDVKSAMQGYLGRQEQNGHRHHTRRLVYSTGDCFREELLDGAKWLRYLCRRDDFLNHSSGEMTNPVPTEQIMLACCPDL
eukprot:7197663-Prymnesium_polylepis.1